MLQFYFCIEMQNLMGIHSRKMTKYAVILSQHHLKCGGKKKERKREFYIRRY
jgi:hypothetical protein